jgi:hypothetical protein
MLKKKIWPNFPRIIEVFTQKLVTKPSKIWVWDPGSEIRKKPLPDPGVKKAPDPGSGSATLVIRIRNEFFWIWIRILLKVSATTGSGSTTLGK